VVRKMAQVVSKQVDEEGVPMKARGPLVEMAFRVCSFSGMDELAEFAGVEEELKPSFEIDEVCAFGAEADGAR